MDEELSLFYKLAIIFCLMGAFLASVLLVAIESRALLTNESNRYTDAEQAIAVNQIAELQSFPQNIFSLQRVLASNEVFVNSIQILSEDGSNTYVAYMRDTDQMTDTSVIDAYNQSHYISSTGLVYIDNILVDIDSADSSSINSFRETAREFDVRVYRTANGHFFDILCRLRSNTNFEEPGG